MLSFSWKNGRLACAALLVAVGLLLPPLFHLIGGQAAGGVLLPMHLPVLLAGLLFGPGVGIAVGGITPLLSFLLSGMPPLIKLPFMILELVTYGAVSGLCCVRGRLPIPVGLLLAQISGRLANALGLWVAAGLLSLPVSGPASVFTALVTGLPGVAVQWLVLPLAARILKKSGVLRNV